MMLRRALVTLFGLIFVAGCTSSGSDPSPPTSPQKLDWNVVCPAFEDILEESFIGLITAPAADYYAYSKKLANLIKGISSSDARPIQRVLVASEKLGDLTVPSDPDPNTPDQLAARDEFMDSIIAARATCKAHGNPWEVAAPGEKTYIPDPADPKTHDVTIIIRDKGRSYAPGTCTAVAPDEHADVLAFSGPDQAYENRPLKNGEFPIPRQGRPLSDGTCEATMKVTLPYAPRYTAGIAQVGGGIPSAEDPRSDTRIVTEGNSQEVVLINYPD